MEEMQVSFPLTSSPPPSIIPLPPTNPTLRCKEDRGRAYFLPPHVRTYAAWTPSVGKYRYSVVGSWPEAGSGTVDRSLELGNELVGENNARFREKQTDLIWMDGHARAMVRESLAWRTLIQDSRQSVVRRARRIVTYDTCF